MDVCAFILQSCKIPPYIIDMGELKKEKKTQIGLPGSYVTISQIITTNSPTPA